MKFVSLLQAGVTASLLTLSSGVFAAQYTIDQAHTSIGFNIKHMFAMVPGRFDKFEGTFEFDPEMKSTGNFNATIETASINTNQADRDKHLRSPDFFNAEKNPKITFKSTKVNKKDKNHFEVVGDLTMNGVTKPVTLAWEYLGEVKDPWGNMKAGFKATGKLNRKDWNIKWNKALDAGGLLLGDEVELVIQVEAENTSAKKKS